MLILIFALVILWLSSFYVFNKWKKVELLDRRLQSIRDLNRQIIKMMPEEKKKEAYKIEMSVGYDYLCSLANNDLVNKGKVISREGEFIKSIYHSLSQQEQNKYHNLTEFYYERLDDGGDYN